MTHQSAGHWVTPDDCPGVDDREKVQSALDEAVASGANVLIDREYDLGDSAINGYAFLRLTGARGLRIVSGNGGGLTCRVNPVLGQPEATVVCETIRMQDCQRVEIVGLSFRDTGTTPHYRYVGSAPWGRIGAIFVSVRNPDYVGEDPSESITVRDCRFSGVGFQAGGAYSAVSVGYQGYTARQVKGVTVDNCDVEYVRYGLTVSDASAIQARRFRTLNVVRTCIVFGAKDVDVEAHVVDPRAIRGVFGIEGARGTRNIRIRADISDVHVWEENNADGDPVEKCAVRSFVNIGHSQVAESPGNLLADIDLDLRFSQPSFGDASCVQFWSRDPATGQRYDVTTSRYDRIRIAGSWPRKERLVEWATRPEVPCNLDISGLTWRPARFVSGDNFFYRMANAQVWLSPVEFAAFSWEGSDAVLRLPDEIWNQPVALEITVHAQISAVPRVGPHVYQGVYRGVFLLRVSSERVLSLESPNSWDESRVWGGSPPAAPTLTITGPSELTVGMPASAAGSGMVICRLI